MAKSPKARTKKKERRYVLQGVVHIQSTFNNTIICSTDPQGPGYCLGIGPVPSVLKALKKALHLQLNKPQNQWLSARWTRA